MDQLGPCVTVEPFQQTWVEAAYEVVEGIHEHPERKVPFELGRRARQHQRSLAIGIPGELLEQAGLADAGFAHQFDSRPPPPPELLESAIEKCELLGAAD